MPSNREEGQSSSHSEDLQRAQPEEFHQKNEIDLVGFFFIFLMKQDLFKFKERKTQIYIFLCRTFEYLFKETFQYGILKILYFFKSRFALKKLKHNFMRLLDLDKLKI